MTVNGSTSCVPELRWARPRAGWVVVLCRRRVLDRGGSSRVAPVGARVKLPWVWRRDPSVNNEPVALSKRDSECHGDLGVAYLILTGIE
jgi:hypothetical protein